MREEERVLMGTAKTPVKHDYERIPYLVAYQNNSDVRDVYGGVAELVVLESYLLKPAVPSDTVLVFMHPIGGGAYLPMINALARAGHHVIYCNSRFRGTDSALLMEKVVEDLGECIKDAKNRLGYPKVVLAGWSGGGSLSMVVRYQGYEPLVRFNPEWTGLEPNVAESWEVSEDSRTYTFKLRKGHKWSDGQPYTTEDVRFWYEDILLDESATITNQSFWYTNGVPGKLEIVDETTFRVVFASPNGFFVNNIAWAQSDHLSRTPAHYLKQFHIKYNENADALAKERGFDSWVALFQREHGLHQDNVFYQNSNRPTLNAWMFTSAPGEDTERAIAVRNPYYHKVDTAGTQLPYFDQVVYQMVADPEVLLLKTLQSKF